MHQQARHQQRGGAWCRGYWVNIFNTIHNIWGNDPRTGVQLDIFDWMLAGMTNSKSVCSDRAARICKRAKILDVVACVVSTGRGGYGACGGYGYVLDAVRWSEWRLLGVAASVAATAECSDGRVAYHVRAWHGLQLTDGSSRWQPITTKHQ